MKNTIAALIGSLLFIACGRNDQKSNVNAPETIVTELRQNESANKSEDKKPMPPTERDEEDNGQKQVPKEIEKQDWDKKIIKTALLNLEIKDFKKYGFALRDKIKQVGGYVAQEQQTESEYKIENIITIKVPVDQFDNAVQLLVNDAEKLNEKKITSEDVTTQFVDTRSRLESKKQVRLRYLDLLKQARNMEEILNVQSEINGVQEEIEAASGRIEYLSHSSAFSTIQLTFFQILNVAAKDSDDPSFSTKVGSAFKNGWSWIVEIFIALVSIWPLLFLVFAGILIYKRTKPTKLKQA